MYASISIVPDEGHQPRAYLGGTTGDIPVVEIISRYDGCHLHLQFSDDATALAYCEALVEQVTGLIHAIQTRHQADLLAAVEDTPHDPQAATAIRAKYAEEEMSR